jgi:hypothetical protein
MKVNSPALNINCSVSIKYDQVFLNAANPAPWKNASTFRKSRKTGIYYLKACQEKMIAT